MGTADSEGFYIVVCAAHGDAPHRDGPGSALLAALRPIVRDCRGGVLVSSAALGRPGTVMTCRRSAHGDAEAPVRWFRPVEDPTLRDALCQWVATGGPGAGAPPDALTPLLFTPASPHAALLN